jgi:hypothetical protein
MKFIFFILQQILENAERREKERDERASKRDSAIQKTEAKKTNYF